MNMIMRVTTLAGLTAALAGCTMEPASTPANTAVAVASDAAANALAGTATAPLNAVPPAATSVQRFSYRCEGLGDVTAQFTSMDGLDATIVTLPTGTMQAPASDRLLLPQGVAASGARYASDAVEFWTKGNDAFLTLRGAEGTTPRQFDCKGTPAAMS